jgi:S1-C subfamily serine protease
VLASSLTHPQIPPFSTEELSGGVYVLARVQPPNAGLIGTAFLVNGKIVTAHHLIGGNDQDVAVIVPRIPRLSNYQDTSDSAVNVSPLRIVADDPIHDLTVLEVSNGPGLSGGFAVGGTDQAMVGGDLYTLGYPHAPNGRMVLTLIRTEVGARILVDSTGIKTKHIILNTQARPGQSGSPVILRATGVAIAMIIGSYAPVGQGSLMIGNVDPATLHQTTHAVSLEYLKGLV